MPKVRRGGNEMNIDHINEYIGLAMNSGVLILLALLIGLALAQIKRLMHQPTVITSSGTVLDTVYQDQRQKIRELETQLARAEEQLKNYSEFEEMIEHAARNSNLG
jgi:DNA-binding transcriptional MerR regulator